jgi:hypothetical protein
MVLGNATTGESIVTTASELALEYFRISNYVAAFYAVQTIVFLSSIPNTPTLLNALCENRSLAVKVTWCTAFLYIVLILGCGFIEHRLHASDGSSKIIRKSSIVAMAGRTFMILSLAWACATLISDHLKPAPVSTAQFEAIELDGLSQWGNSAKDAYFG